jgi:hypothetical protein
MNLLRRVARFLLPPQPTKESRYNMTFREAMEILGEEHSFEATVYAMNTLLHEKGIYSGEEFSEYFIEHAINFQRGFRGTSGKLPKVVNNAHSLLSGNPRNTTATGRS